MRRTSFTAFNGVFEVNAEYEFVKQLGQGAYGCVVSARHIPTGQGCAIKKITNINTKVCFVWTLPILFYFARTDHRRLDL